MVCGFTDRIFPFLMMPGDCLTHEHETIWKMSSGMLFPVQRDIYR